MKSIATKTTVEYLRSEEARYGALPALLRDIADTIEARPDITTESVKIVPRNGHSNWGIHSDEWMVTMKGRLQHERYPAGVAGPCSVCGGDGSNEDHALDVWDDDYELYRCVACDGTGYQTAETTDPRPAA